MLLRRITGPTLRGWVHRVSASVNGLVTSRSVYAYAQPKLIITLYLVALFLRIIFFLLLLPSELFLLENLSFLNIKFDQNIVAISYRLPNAR